MNIGNTKHCLKGLVVLLTGHLARLLCCLLNWFKHFLLILLPYHSLYFPVDAGWVWTDHDTPTSYTNWGEGEPNDRGTEDCMEMWITDASWNDENCNSERDYVCKIHKGKQFHSQWLYI